LSRKQPSTRMMRPQHPALPRRTRLSHRRKHAKPADQRPHRRAHDVGRLFRPGRVRARRSGDPPPLRRRPDRKRRPAAKHLLVPGPTARHCLLRRPCWAFAASRVGQDQGLLGRAGYPPRPAQRGALSPVRRSRADEPASTPAATAEAIISCRKGSSRRPCSSLHGPLTRISLPAASWPAGLSRLEHHGPRRPPQTHPLPRLASRHA
jgi:hypothetical protein